ncbi:MAG TPA: orotate phosphoribosyltransferase [Candidatus Bathyarchaeia archaeon]|nr:orotate phosphoribosyltransferase [Candidatus Bathyarchaeia archaeon]
MTKKEKLILELLRNKCIEFGSFKLKSGVISPYYIDIRKLVSYPKLLKKVAIVYWSLVKKLNFDRLAGVPYAALPVATVMNVLYDMPMVYTRKEQQTHGITKLVQGEYKKDETVVVIDDIITTGESKLMVIKPLEESGLKVKDVVLLIDRENGGKEIIEKAGYKLHTVFLMTSILAFLLKKKKVSKKLYQKCIDFMKKTKRENLKKLK